MKTAIKLGVEERVSRDILRIIEHDKSAVPGNGQRNVGRSLPVGWF